MDKTILNIFKVISLILIGLAVVFQIIVLIKGEEGLIGSSVLDNFMRVGYIAFAITTFLTILFPILFIVQNPKNALKLLVVLGGVVVIGFICFSLASNAFNIVQLESLKTTTETSKAVGAALYFTYIIGGLAVVSIIFSGIAGLFK